MEKLEIGVASRRWKNIWRHIYSFLQTPHDGIWAALMHSSVARQKLMCEGRIWVMNWRWIFIKRVLFCNNMFHLKRYQSFPPKVNQAIGLFNSGNVADMSDRICDFSIVTKYFFAVLDVSSLPWCQTSIEVFFTLIHCTLSQTSKPLDVW